MKALWEPQRKEPIRRYTKENEKKKSLITSLQKKSIKHEGSMKGKAGQSYKTEHNKNTNSWVLIYR